MSGVDSRNLDATARNILQDCAANTTSVPNNEIVLSNFAESVSTLGYYGYFINQGLFSNIAFLQNFTNLVLREINSLCVSTAANSSIVDENSLAMYISDLNIANLTQITCTLFCPICPTRSISTIGDNINSIHDLCLSVSNTSLVMNCPCGDGTVGIAEICDDGNRMNDDGCNNECYIEQDWNCETIMLQSRCSNCGNYMLEFNEQCDHSSDGCDSCMIKSLYNCVVFDGVIGYTNCTKVNLDTNTTDLGSVDSTYMTPDNIFLLSIDLVDVYDFTNTVNYTLTFSKVDNPDINPQSNPVTVNAIRLRENLGLETLFLSPTLEITSGDLFVTTYSIDEEFISTNGRGGEFKDCLLAFINATQIDVTDRPVGSQVKVQISVSSHPLLESENFILGTANIFLTSIGTDDTAPEITLPLYTPVFYEGNISISIVSPFSTVIDVNDMFYLIQSLKIILTDAPDSHYEWISIANLSDAFSDQFDNFTLTLTITGPGTRLDYTDILRNIVYRNTKPEPTAGNRRIFISARDTVQESTTQMQTLSVVNINDIPVLMLSRTNVDFIENSNEVVLDGLIELSDEDPQATIQYAYIQFTAVDPGDELISFQDGTQNILQVNNTYLETTAFLPLETVQSILRGVSYIHISDDPTSGPRVILFAVVDNNDGTTSVEFTVNVQAVNDRPVVTLSRTVFIFQENSAPILFGDAIALSDADSSNFSRMVFEITDIPSGNYFENELLFVGTPNILLNSGVTFVNNIFSARFTLTNNRFISDYQSIVNTVRYNNTHDGDFSEIEGNRTVIITAFDLDDFASLRVELTIQLTRVNDAPLIDIGSGLGQNWTFEFTEFNSSSMESPSNEEHIVFQPFLDIFDEENDDIMSLSATLVVNNGELDPNEFIYVRSSLLGLFDNSTDLFSSSTGTYMLFYGVGSVQNYTDILRSLFYTNDENEPTLFPIGDRFVVITITDVLGASNSIYSIIDTIPINDNKPVVFINLHPGQPDVLTQTRTSREIATFEALNFTAFISNRATNTKLTTGDMIEIQFEDDMDQINLGNRAQLESLLHFNQEVYNELPKYSYWKDAKTLLIVFPRIDEHYSPKIFDSQKYNLSIIFKDCKLPYKKCTNLCAKKTPLACAKGETNVVISISKPKINYPSQHLEAPLLSSGFIRIFLITICMIVSVSVIICIIRAFTSVENIPAKKAAIVKDAKFVDKNGFQHIPPKSDEEQIHSLKGRKYKAKKLNPRATPNIFKHVMGEN